MQVVLRIILKRMEFLMNDKETEDVLYVVEDPLNPFRNPEKEPITHD